ncbi:MAG: hypothetical protein ABIH82_00490 [Candidatus Woesearchaeota archaeon]
MFDTVLYLDQPRRLGTSMLPVLVRYVLSEGDLSRLDITLERGEQDMVRSTVYPRLRVFPVNFNYHGFDGDRLIVVATESDVVETTAYGRSDKNFRRPLFSSIYTNSAEQLATCALLTWMQTKRGDASNTDVDGPFQVNLFSRLNRKTDTRIRIGTPLTLDSLTDPYASPDAIYAALVNVNDDIE